MKILITGATGFIGSHLAERLSKEYEIRALVRKKDSKSRKETFELLKELGVEIFEGDLTDRQSLEKATEGIDIIFHLAAIARPMAISDEMYFKINEQGTKNLLDACRNKKIKKIIIMSSVSAVGPTRDGIAVNEKSQCQPVDVYGWSKLAQEKVGMNFFQRYNMPIVFLRPPMVFGPRDFEMLKLFKAVSMRLFPVKSDEKGMEFLYVENLVEACILALKHGKQGEKYHISNGEHYSINQIIKGIEDAEGKKVLPIKFPKTFFVFLGYLLEITGKVFNFKPPFKHDTIEWMTKKFWYSDISKARRELKYSPVFMLEEGIKKTADYYKSKGYI